MAVIQWLRATYWVEKNRKTSSVTTIVKIHVTIRLYSYNLSIRAFH